MPQWEPDTHTRPVVGPRRHQFDAERYSRLDNVTAQLVIAQVPHLKTIESIGSVSPVPRRHECPGAPLGSHGCHSPRANALEFGYVGSWARAALRGSVFQGCSRIELGLNRPQSRRCDADDLGMASGAAWSARRDYLLRLRRSRGPRVGDRRASCRRCK